ncbi:MAG: LysM peptidoglycan-binding domain-containing protein [Roseburia sp.]|nr:LysM peptidoglycan-binding domain-containing protein [Roseburia sp.]MCM1099654.1 LysM peptidoglycan-binding domain-containing protein [Ruminococcus flavefaciens]
MELPKNVTQIGETNHSCKIYVEDYVISYIRQLNGYAMDKGLAAALYGVRKEEAGITYLFFYGAGKLNFLQREARHLSQAVLQETEKQRKKYFEEYAFLGYCLLNGEMVEGFYVYEQGVCRYIKGYAQFYEKNDSMLRFMLEERQEEAKPEEFDQEKYETVKRRQEERRSIAEAQGQGMRSIYRKKEQPKKGGDVQLRQMKLAAAAVFVLLCGAGLAAMDGGQRLGELRAAVSDMMAGASEKQLPDAVEVSNGTAQVGTIVAEDKLTEAIQKENQGAAGTEGQNEPPAGTPSGAENGGLPPQGEGSENVGQDGENSTDGTQPAGMEGIGNPPDGTQPAGTEGEENPSDGTPSGTENGGNPTDGTQPAGTESGENPLDGTQPAGAESGGNSSGEAQPSGAGNGEEADAEPSSEPVSYTVRRGDTLIGICLARYGSDARVAEICSLNHIENPDEIKVGEKILLP